MATRLVAFTVGEWFHCYSRTVDKSRPFERPEFAERFLETLFFANSTGPIPNIPNLHNQYSHEEMFSLPRQQPLVAIGAYCLMPTHYHMLMQPLVENGVTQFMHKVGTGFTRFYNEQNERIGNLFVKPFRAKHIGTDNYLDRVAQYIHLNPIELFEPEWKKGRVSNEEVAAKKLRAYEYSSLWEHEGGKRSQSSILNLAALGEVRDNSTNAVHMIADAAEYYRFLELDL